MIPTRLLTDNGITHTQRWHRRPPEQEKNKEKQRASKTDPPPSRWHLRRHRRSLVSAAENDNKDKKYSGSDLTGSSCQITFGSTAVQITEHDVADGLIVEERPHERTGAAARAWRRTNPLAGSSPESQSPGSRQSSDTLWQANCSTCSSSHRHHCTSCTTNHARAPDNQDPQVSPCGPAQQQAVTDHNGSRRHVQGIRIR